jgi:hypothetical protein
MEEREGEDVVLVTNPPPTVSRHLPCAVYSVLHMHVTRLLLVVRGLFYAQ